MMKDNFLFIDSHCHLTSIDLSPFQNDMANVLSLAYEAGVGQFLSVCVTFSDVSKLLALSRRFNQVYFSVGLHPNDVADKATNVESLVALSAHKKCIAIGETGLDYYRMDDPLGQALQQQSFRTHIRAALQTQKPLIIHTREAAEDTLNVMHDEGAGAIGGVMHCFSEDWSVAKRALDMNFYISFSGILTFKNAIQMQEVAKKVPMDRVLIETDSPYLAPVPFRGQQNHPALVRHVALKLAELKGVDLETIAKKTTENFHQCFRVSV